MDTYETSLRTSTPYFIEYVHEAGPFYFQLVRTEDQAILYANPDLQYVYAHCFVSGITVEQISLW